jgi:hypothetical protein
MSPSDDLALFWDRESSDAVHLVRLPIVEEAAPAPAPPPVFRKAQGHPPSGSGPTLNMDAFVHGDVRPSAVDPSPSHGGGVGVDVGAGAGAGAHHGAAHAHPSVDVAAVPAAGAARGGAVLSPSSATAPQRNGHGSGATPTGAGAAVAQSLQSFAQGLPSPAAPVVVEPPPLPLLGRSSDHASPARADGDVVDGGSVAGVSKATVFSAAASVTSDPGAVFGSPSNAPTPMPVRRLVRADSSVRSPVFTPKLIHGTGEASSTRPTGDGDRRHTDAPRSAASSVLAGIDGVETVDDSHDDSSPQQRFSRDVPLKVSVPPMLNVGDGEGPPCSAPRLSCCCRCAR